MKGHTVTHKEFAISRIASGACSKLCGNSICGTCSFSRPNYLFWYLSTAAMIGYLLDSNYILTIEPTNWGWFMPAYKCNNGESLRAAGSRALSSIGHISGINHPLVGSAVVRYCQIWFKRKTHCRMQMSAVMAWTRGSICDLMPAHATLSSH